MECCYFLLKADRRDSVPTMSRWYYVILTGAMRGHFWQEFGPFETFTDAVESIKASFSNHAAHIGKG
jgi:hypothetical protein